MDRQHGLLPGTRAGSALRHRREENPHGPTGLPKGRALFACRRSTVCRTTITRFETQTLGSRLQTIGIQGTTYIHPLHFHLHSFTPLPPFYHYITFLVEISWTMAAFPERLALAPRREVSTMREPYTDYQQYEKKRTGTGRARECHGLRPAFESFTQRP